MILLNTITRKPSGAVRVLWAWEAMSPHDAPEQPTSADQDSGKGQVPAGAENAPETAEILAELERYLSFDPNKYDRYTIRPVVMPDGRSALEHFAERMRGKGE